MEKSITYCVYVNVIIVVYFVKWFILNGQQLFVKAWLQTALLYSVYEEK